MKNLTDLPSGITASKNGKYFYWQCNVTGIKTFADAARFNSIVQKYGNIETLAKEFVLPTAKRYLKEGWDKESLAALIKANDGKLPALGKTKDKPATKKRFKRALKAHSIGSESIPASDTEQAKERAIYPWSSDPDYFKGSISPLNISEVTKNTCLYPNRHIDDQCFGCSIYEACSFSGKFKPEDWKKKNPRNEVIIKQIDTSS